jgi:hypothetical protein
MAKTPKNDGRHWTSSHNARLRERARGNTPTGLIAWELGRSKSAVYSQASELGVSLRPTNQSPYNRRRR